MKNILEICKSLSDRNRLTIIFALMKYDELCACQLIELLNISGATTSRHLSILTGANLVNSRKSGRWVYYQLNKEQIKPISKWLKDEFKDSIETEEIISQLEKIVSEDTEKLCSKQRTSS